MRRVTTMRALLLAVLLAVSAWHLRAQTPAPPFVIVQAVDPVWLPVPGAAVHLRERGGGRTVHKSTTNADGFASFRLDPRDVQQSYDISVVMAGFKDGELSNVRFGSCSGDCSTSHYVQIRLALPDQRSSSSSTSAHSTVSDHRRQRRM